MLLAVQRERKELDYIYKIKRDIFIKKQIINIYGI